jgi:hypothetical protein
LSTAESTAHMAASESAAAATTAASESAATMTTAASESAATTTAMTAAATTAMFGGQGVRHHCSTKRDGNEEDHDLACDGLLLDAGR